VRTTASATGWAAFLASGDTPHLAPLWTRIASTLQCHTLSPTIGFIQMTPTVRLPHVQRSHRPWLVACDESGTGGASHYGFGTLWLPWDRRGDLVQDLEDIGRQHGVHLQTADGIPHEFKWQKVKRQKLSFYSAVVDYFFERPWLSFHCLLVRLADVDRTLHRNLDEARRKHFVMLLANKIRRALERHPARTAFHIWVDPIASAYRKADEAVEVITTRVVQKLGGTVSPSIKVTTRDSHSTRAIQLCDLLLGAVMAPWQGDVQAAGKLLLQKRIADHLGWVDLHADTFKTAAKFNIWRFCNPKHRPTDVRTRALHLRNESINSSTTWTGPGKPQSAPRE
jgi:hypothetical protein